jgi:hypothetical protein
MIETFGILIPFLIADVLNPVLFAFMVYAAGTQRPVVTSAAMLLGHTAAYFGAGIVIALGLEKITHYLANPSSIDYLIALSWDCCCSGSPCRRRRSPRRSARKTAAR